MQKKVIQVNFALYKDIENLQKSAKINSSVLTILNKLKDAASQDKKHWVKLLGDAKAVKNEFVKKADELGLNVQGSENMQIIDSIIDRSVSNEQKMDLIESTINNLYGKLAK